MKKTQFSDLIKQFRSVHGNTYDYTESVFINVDTPITVICPKHGAFYPTPYNHRKGSGCRRCGVRIALTKRTGTNRPKNQTEVINEFKNVHGDRYDYSRVVYNGADVPVEVICPEHGSFFPTPVWHKKRTGCPHCSRFSYTIVKGTRKKKVKSAHTTERFIIDSRKIHGDRYDYSRVHYVDNQTKVTISCRIHGDFSQLPADHRYNGSGCPSCGRYQAGQARKHSTRTFITKASRIHGTKYDYSKTLYRGDSEKVEIICRRHGSFWQKATNHLNNRNGCPRCSSKVSRASQEWLDSMGVPNLPSTREVYGLIPGRRFAVDGYDPRTRTVYEFWGDFAHGNPNRYKPTEINPKYKCTFGELYRKTMEKRYLFEQEGFNIIEIWESEWKHNKRDQRCGLSELIPESKVV